MAKNLIVCQFCGMSKRIKWKCFYCDLVMCQKCKEKHSKFGGSEEHCIIDLKQVGTPENVDIIRQFNLKNIRCELHTDEKCSLFCKDCNKPVCSYCVLEPDHKGHNLDKLSTVYNNQLSELKDIKEKIKKTLPDLRKKVSENTATCDNYNKTKQKIIQREKEIKDKATKEAAILIDELDKIFIPGKDAFMEENQRIQERETKLKEINNEIDAALQSHQATCVLSTINKVDRYVEPNTNSDIIPLGQKLRFIVQDLPSINFGSLKKCPVLKVINTLETNVSGFLKLRSFKDGTLICTYSQSNHFYMGPGYYLGRGKVLTDKLIIKPDVSYSDDFDYPHDMTVTDDETILVNTKYGLKCENNGKFSLFEISNTPFSEDIFHTKGIHSFDQTIVVGFETYPSQEIGVLFLDKHGHCFKTLRKTKCDSDYQILHQINKLTTNSKGDIIINSGVNISLYDSRFTFKWTYQNSHELNDIVTTPDGLIVMADELSIHVLSMDGELLTSIGEQEGICHPKCVHNYVIGQLLVACYGGYDKNANIHVVKVLDS